jgi:hypothetical protein
MENNHRENTRRRSGTRIGQLPLQIRIWTAPDLSYTGAGDAACSTVLKPAMDTYRGEIIGIANPHDNCHCPACRHPGEKDPGGIDGILRTNLIHHPGEYGRLPTPALLIEGIIPAPTSARVMLACLLWIEDKKGMGIRQHVKTGATRKIIGVLSASMQGYQQRGGHLG